MTGRLHLVLRLIINETLMAGVFPNKLNIAVVNPIYRRKWSNPHEFCNYRSILLLPTLNEFFQKVVYKQFYEYFNQKNYLTIVSICGPNLEHRV